MKITSSRLSRYRKELEAIGDDAVLYVEAMMGAFLEEHPDATVAQIRDAADEVMQDMLFAFGDEASTLACDLFDEIAEAAGMEVVSEIQDDVIDLEKMNEKLRYFARDLIEGNVAGFNAKVTDLTRYYVKRSAYENMVRNCDRNDVRYARVPSGIETCSFCFMLCSRGFVYHSEITAKGRSLHGVHNHCDCVVVPGFAGLNWSTQIEGYDPKGMQERWSACAETCGSNKPKDIMKECETRDFRWLYTGKSSPVTYSTKQVESKVKLHELRTANRLALLGVKPEFIQDYIVVTNERGLKKKVGLSDFRNGVEIKTIMTSKNPYGALSNHLDSTVGKRGVKRVIVDNSEALFISDEDLLKAAKDKISEYPEIQMLTLLLKSGKLVNIK